MCAELSYQFHCYSPLNLNSHGENYRSEFSKQKKKSHIDNDIKLNLKLFFKFLKRPSNNEGNILALKLTIGLQRYSIMPYYLVMIMIIIIIFIFMESSTFLIKQSIERTFFLGFDFTERNDRVILSFLANFFGHQMSPGACNGYVVLKRELFILVVLCGVWIWIWITKKKHFFYAERRLLSKEHIQLKSTQTTHN